VATSTITMAVLPWGKIRGPVFLVDGISGASLALATIAEQGCLVDLVLTCLGMVLIFGLDLDTVECIGLPMNVVACTWC